MQRPLDVSNRFDDHTQSRCQLLSFGSRGLRQAGRPPSSAVRGCCPRRGHILRIAVRTPKGRHNLNPRHNHARPRPKNIGGFDLRQYEGQREDDRLDFYDASYLQAFVERADWVLGHPWIAAGEIDPKLVELTMESAAGHLRPLMFKEGSHLWIPYTLERLNPGLTSPEAYRLMEAYDAWYWRETFALDPSDKLSAVAVIRQLLYGSFIHADMWRRFVLGDQTEAAVVVRKLLGVSVIASLREFAMIVEEVRELIVRHRPFLPLKVYADSHAGMSSTEGDSSAST